MDPIELLKEHCEFKNPYDMYVMLLVSRRKDSDWITNKQEIVFRETIKQASDIKRKYNRLKALAENYRDEEGRAYPFYLYVSLNPRDALKATHLLMHQILNWLYEDKVCEIPNHILRLKRVDSFYYSALMKKESKSSSCKYFMIDFDENEPGIIALFRDILYNEGVEIILEQPTKNGVHFKVLPFDVRKLDNEHKKFDFEIKKDCNLFVDYFNAREEE